MINKSLSTRTKLSIKNKANNATNNLPTTAAGTKFFDFSRSNCYSTYSKPNAQINPNISP